MGQAMNPYAAPAARVDDSGADSAAEATRREHIGREAAIKTAGFLYYLAGVVLVLAAFAPQTPGDREAKLAMLLAFLALGVTSFFAGWGVRAFRPWGRIVGGVLSAIGLIGFPIGTLVNGYILYLFASKKGQVIFSPAYQAVIAATPHVKYRTPIAAWVFLALLLVLVLVGIYLSP